MGNETSASKNDEAISSHDHQPEEKSKMTDSQRDRSQAASTTLREPPQYEGSPIGVAVLGTGQRAMSLTTKLIMHSSSRVKLFLYDDVEEPLKQAKRYLASVMVIPTGEDSDKYVTIVDSVDAAVSHPEVQWVMVTAKNCLHKDYCIAALEAGKNVFCEKPLATTIDECIAIKDATVKANKLFMTGFVLRYSPFYSKIQSLVEEGFLGKIVTMEANEMLGADHGGYIFRNWRRFKEQSGPHIMEKCAHDIDILNWMAGSVVTKVSAFGGTDIFTPENKPTADKLQEEGDHHYAPLYKGWSAWEDVDPFTSEKSIEDNVVAILQYRNGIRATFQTNCCTSLPQRQLKIFGVEGSLDGDSMTGTFTAKRMARGSEQVNEKFKGGQHAGGDHSLVYELWCAMVYSVTCCAGDGEGSSEAAAQAREDLAGFQLKSSLAECFISSITCLAIDEAREKGEIVDLEKYWERLGV